MENATPLVISISRQKGCGGAYLGQRLARALGILYLDQELVAEIAKKLGEPIEFVEAHDERVVSLWESMIESLSCSYPWSYTPPPAHVAAYQVAEQESEAIMKIAYEKSVVIVGRGASYLLRDHPKHVSVYLYASMQSRSQRVREIYNLPHQEAMKLIDKVDIERERYKKSLSGLDPRVATQYHIALDTGVLGLEKTEALILQYVHLRFGVC